MGRAVMVSLMSGMVAHSAYNAEREDEAGHRSAVTTVEHWLIAVTLTRASRTPDVALLSHRPGIAGALCLLLIRQVHYPSHQLLHHVRFLPSPRNHLFMRHNRQHWYLHPSASQLRRDRRQCA